MIYPLSATGSFKIKPKFMRKLILIILVLCMSMMLKAELSKTITNLTAGELKLQMTSEELRTVTNLTVSGTMDSRDFRTLNQEMFALTKVDLTNIQIEEYKGFYGSNVMNEYKTYPANSIPEMAFYGNISITSIVLPSSIVAIGANAFGYCKSLTSINLPSTVISIGDYAFWNSNQLTSVSIPSSITSIGKYAFSNCHQITSILIPSSVTSIGIAAFTDCTAEIIVDSENINFSSVDGILFNKEKTVLIQCPISKTGEYTIPSSVTTVNQGAFFLCSLITSVILPNTITTIGDRAFKACGKLTSITIPNSVTMMGAETFSYCYNLTSVIISKSVTTIGNDLFSGCSSLTSIAIPDLVTTIGDHAFDGCTALGSVIMPNSVNTIGDAAFSGCSSLPSITIPDLVSTIGVNAFGGCTGLRSVTIPNSVTKMDGAFYGCWGLRSVILPNSVTSINDSFAFCSGLTSVTIPNSVTTMKGTFKACSHLTSITIPGSVKSIGESTFMNCSQLATINAYPTTPPEISSSYVFEGVDKNTCVLNVPAGSLNLYKAADGWKDFIKTGVITSIGKGMKNEAISISPNPARDVITIHAQKGIASIYNSNGKLVITQLLEENKQVNISSLQPGIYMIVVNGESFKVIKE